MTDIVITEFLEPQAVDVLALRFKVHWDRELWNKREMGDEFPNDEQLVAGIKEAG